ncbi:hypothetical protein [Butyricimonas paravirosa]|uniref:hypothetical protein n=1 Tax=Butyricimonas paravirosa TaxID=1472417 RepID=UPI0022DEEF91|nr:hypothetical protein [Butyricimonas paravirosa]
MLIIDSLHSVFDRKTGACRCGDSNWEVIEDDAGASFIRLTFHKEGGSFGVIANDFYKSLSAVTNDRSSFLLDKDCDGVSFYEDGDVDKLLFVDLKSSFSESSIDKAYKQNFFTFLKLHMMLSLCEGYKLESLKIEFFAACPPCKTQDEFDSIKDNILMAEETGDDRFINKCLKSYFYDANNVYSCKVGKIPYVKGKKLHENILSTDVTFRIFTPEHLRDSEGILEL